MASVVSNRGHFNIRTVHRFHFLTHNNVALNSISIKFLINEEDTDERSNELTGITSKEISQIQDGPRGTLLLIFLAELWR